MIGVTPQAASKRWRMRILRRAGHAQREPKAKDHKNSAINPQSATPTSSSDHSEGFSANNLPSLTTYAIIAGTRCGP
jgi:hypothetical protein